MKTRPKWCSFFFFFLFAQRKLPFTNHLFFDQKVMPQRKLVPIRICSLLGGFLERFWRNIIWWDFHLSHKIGVGNIGMWGFPSKRWNKDFRIFALTAEHLSLCQFLDNGIQVDVIRLLAELVATLEVDMLPCNRRDLLDSNSLLSISGSLFERQ